MRLAALVLVAGCGRLGFDDAESSRYAFVDDSQATFDLGTYDTGSAQLAFRDGLLQLAAAPPYARSDVGIYVSRVFDSGDPLATWDTLAWLGPVPQLRALANNEGTDDGYREGGVRMVGNILLLHFDGAGAAAGDPVPDASGKLHDGVLTYVGQAARYSAGAFGRALEIDRDAYVKLDGSYFDYGIDDFTYAVWVKMFDCNASNDNRVALGGAGAGDTPHMWIGALGPDPCGGGDGAFMNWLDSTRNGGSVSVCTGVRLDDGNWHHLAGVKTGHSPATLRLYVDGKEVGMTMFDYAGTFTYDAGESRLGSFNLADPKYHTKVVVDEAAIWKRALDASEIRFLHQRGALRLELQVRVCADDTCDAELFVGPDGTSATYFTEADLVGVAGAQRGNLAGLGLVGRAAQYRVRFSTAAPDISPALQRVELAARPP